jgi:hypothetical protein
MKIHILQVENIILPLHPILAGQGFNISGMFNFVPDFQ